MRRNGQVVASEPPSDKSLRPPAYSLTSLFLEAIGPVVNTLRKLSGDPYVVS